MAVPNTVGPKIHWLAYFWPGLPQLWIRGSWAGLLVAVGFTALGNVLLLATLVYSEWLTLETRLVGGCALAIVWLLARWQSGAERRANSLAAAHYGTATGETDEETTEQPTAERDLLFREAQGHYLRNDWVATEQVLLKLLKQDARDVESRLMLATLWRHQGRSAEALRQLDRLERLEAAANWQHEITAERMAASIQIDVDEATEVEATNMNDASLKRPESLNDANEEIDRRDDENRRAA